MEALEQTTRGAGDMDAELETREVMVVTIPESQEPDQIRINTLEKVQQESVIITADSTVGL